MPIQYTNITDEHNAVRQRAGLFDVSHMGELIVKGPDSLAFLNKVVPQNISKLTDSKAVYCQLPNKNGGLIDFINLLRQICLGVLKRFNFA